MKLRTVLLLVKLFQWGLVFAFLCFDHTAFFQYTHARSPSCLLPCFARSGSQQQLAVQFKPLGHWSPTLCQCSITCAIKKRFMTFRQAVPNVGLLFVDKNTSVETPLLSILGMSVFIVSQISSVCLMTDEYYFFSPEEDSFLKLETRNLPLWRK